MNKISLKAGVVEGAYYDAKGIIAVALIPSRDALLSRLWEAWQAPMANFARVIDQIAEKKAGRSRSCSGRGVSGTGTGRASVWTGSPA